MCPKLFDALCKSCDPCWQDRTEDQRNCVRHVVLISLDEVMKICPSGGNKARKTFEWIIMCVVGRNANPFT